MGKYEPKGFGFIKVNFPTEDKAIWIMSERRITENELVEAMNRMRFRADLGDLGFDYYHSDNLALECQFMLHTDEKEAVKHLRWLNNGGNTKNQLEVVGV